MTATSGGNEVSRRITGRILIATLIATLGLGFLTIGAAGAQSAGCAGGPYDGATALDSDGDGVNDADETIAGTDACDPASAPTSVCGSFVVNYDASTADTDSDGHTDAAEAAAGTDACSSASAPTSVCGSLVANYDASTADTDSDGHTDAAEVAAGTDACDATSVISAAVGNTAATTVDTQEAPTLALTGPSTAAVSALLGIAALLLGFAAMAMSRRVEA